MQAKEKLLSVPESIVRGLIELLNPLRTTEAVALMSADLGGDTWWVRQLLWTRLPSTMRAEEDLRKMHKVEQWFLWEFDRLNGDKVSMHTAKALKRGELYAHDAHRTGAHGKGRAQVAHLTPRYGCRPPAEPHFGSEGPYNPRHDDNGTQCVDSLSATRNRSQGRLKR